MITKIHLTSKNIPGRFLCGLRTVTKQAPTDDPAKVTCRRCLKLLRIKGVCQLSISM